MHGMLLGRVVQQRSEAMAVLCQSMCVLLWLARVSYLNAKIVLDVRGPGHSTTVVSALLLPPLAMVSNGELPDIQHDSRAVIQDWDGLSGPTLSWICVGYEFRSPSCVSGCGCFSHGGRYYAVCMVGMWAVCMWRCGSVCWRYAPVSGVV